MQGHRQKVKSPKKEKEEETKFPLAFHAEGKKGFQSLRFAPAVDDIFQ